MSSKYNGNKINNMGVSFYIIDHNIAIRNWVNIDMISFKYMVSAINKKIKQQKENFLIRIKKMETA